MIIKVLPFEVKEVAPRVLEFVGSTGDKDRMGDIIETDGWELKQYKKNPVFVWAHQYEQPPIGKANRVWVEDNKLKFHIQFPTKEEYEFADTIYKLYKGGYLRATSVGFQPLESEPMETKDEEPCGGMFQPMHYIRQELLELSGCPVPANPNALAEAKEVGLITVKQLEAIMEIQSAISFQSAHPNGTPKAGEDEDWDAGKEVAAAEVDDLKAMCAIVQGDADLKTSYKLPHHKAKGHAVVWKGVAAAGAVLMGGRGGIDATEAEKTGAKGHLGKHYAEFSKEPPWEKGLTKAELADELDYVATLLKVAKPTLAMWDAMWDIVRCIVRSCGDEIPLDIQEKIGAVLNKANRERLEKIKTLAQEVIDSAQHEEEPEKQMTEESVLALVEKTVSDAIWRVTKLSRR